MPCAVMRAGSVGALEGASSGSREQMFTSVPSRALNAADFIITFGLACVGVAYGGRRSGSISTRRE